MSESETYEVEKAREWHITFLSSPLHTGMTLCGLPKREPPLRWVIGQPPPVVCGECEKRYLESQS